MKAHRSSIELRFSSAAASYEQHARIQDRVAERVDLLCSEAARPGRVLEIGCGTGLLTRRILRRYPEAELTVMDLSSAMLEQTRSQIPETANTHWVQGDLAEGVGANSFDLAVASSSLHWIRPLEKAFRALAEALRPCGQLTAAIMLRDTLQELHSARADVVPDLPAGSRLPSAEQVEELLQNGPWQVEHFEIKELVDHYPTAWDFLRVLRSQGLTGGPFSRGRRPLTRTELRRLADVYEIRFKEKSGVRATYEVLYLLAKLKGTKVMMAEC